MRILISHPDTIGDLVLRQPMLAALRAAGHELMMVVRPSVESLARQLSPGSVVVAHPAEVYALTADGPWAAFEPVFAACRAFGPDLLVVAPFRWTLFEEQLAARLPETPTAGLAGHLYRGDPFAGAAPVSTLRLDRVAPAREDTRETDKNASLVGMIFGHPVRLPDPKLDVPADDLAEARRLLDEAGFAPGAYWAACVGGTEHVAIKTWPAERWGAALSRWADRYGRRFLFVGLPDELPAVEAVRAAMGPAAGATATAMGGGVSLGVLQGLVALSQGYVGHDTGPMHVAAALGRPVLAVFGGGTWGRFLPAVEPSVAVMVGVPCAGCGWVCPFDASYCIKSVPVDDVLAAIDDLEAGRVTGREWREVRPPAALTDRLIRESVAAAEARLREATEARKHLVAARAGDGPPGTVMATGRVIEAGTAVGTVTADGADADAPPAARPSLATATNALDRGAFDRASNGHATTAVAAGLSEPGPSFDDALARHTAPLREQVGRLEARLKSLAGEVELRVPATDVAKPRRPWRQVLVDLAIGRQHIYPKPPVPFPPVSVVVPAAGDLHAVRATVESVLAQDYRNLECVVVDDGSSAELTTYVASLAGRARPITVPESTSPYELAHHGVEQSYGQVIGLLRPGVGYEPGALARAGELFRDNRGAKVAYFEASDVRAGGWRSSLGPARRVDVVDLLAGEPVVYESLFFRREAYRFAGGLRHTRGAAADWDLAIRLARMFGLTRGVGSAAVVGIGGGVHRATAKAGTDPARASSLEAARRHFRKSFGLPGRVRCGAIHRFNRAMRWADERSAVGRLSFAPPAGPTPTIDGPVPSPADAPRCPLTRRAADRLLFSDVGPAGGVVHVYHCPGSAAAVVHAPAQGADDRPGAPPAPSPYAGYRGRGTKALTADAPFGGGRVPTSPANVVLDALAAATASLPAGRAARSLIDLACGEGAVLDAFAPRGRAVGVESDPALVAAARSRGHEVVVAAPFDAALAVPDGQTFDVVLLGLAVQRSPDPLALVRRARQLMNPGGLMLVTADNLDSRLVDLFGPAWAGWDVGRNRTILSPRAVKRIAAAAGLSVRLLRTQTYADRAAVSVARHRTGVAPAIDAPSPDDVQVGRRLAGWGQSSWNWRGRGDVLHAVLVEANG